MLSRPWSTHSISASCLAPTHHTAPNERGKTEIQNTHTNMFLQGEPIHIDACKEQSLAVTLPSGFKI